MTGSTLNHKFPIVYDVFTKLRLLSTKLEKEHFLLFFCNHSSRVKVCNQLFLEKWYFNYVSGDRPSVIIWSLQVGGSNLD